MKNLNLISSHSALLLCLGLSATSASSLIGEDIEALRQQIEAIKSQTSELVALHEKIVRLKDDASNTVELYENLKTNTNIIDESIVVGNNLLQVQALEERLEGVRETIMEQYVFYGSEASEDTPYSDDAVTFQELRDTFLSFEDFENKKDNSAISTSKQIWETELELESYALSLGKKFINNYVNEMIKVQQLEFESNQKESKNEVLTCVSKKEAVDMIKEAVVAYVNNDIDNENYALEYSGASIVYEDGYTSETYTPPNAIIPSYIWNMFGGLPQIFFGKSPIKSANHVLSGDSIEVGSFWAFSGNKGKITIKLSQPVYVTSVSIEHASNMLLDPSTAPRSFNVVGYEPCNINDCETLGFDPVSEGILLGSFEYKAEPGAKSIQAFYVDRETLKLNEISTDEEEGNDEESENAGSCGIESTPESCNDDLLKSSMQSKSIYPEERPLFAALSFEFNENHGGLYTSLYRLRVYSDY